MELFAAFGIDWRLLVVNLINFLLLLLGLWYFLYTPLLNTLEARRQKLVRGIEDADEAKRQLADIEASRAGVLADAGKEADSLLAHARRSALEKEHERVAAGEAAAATLVHEATAQASELKARAIAESKQEVARLIVLGMERMGQEGAHTTS